MANPKVSVGVVGLGWIGKEVSLAALSEPNVRLVGACDVDPKLKGRDLGAVLGKKRLGLIVHSELKKFLRATKPDVVLLTTSSDPELVLPMVNECVRFGAHVVTTCENLVDRGAQLGLRVETIDRAARKKGSVVLSTGVNPGFAMDRLPVILSQATRGVRSLKVTRVLDAAKRRPQLQAKIGVGLSKEEFVRRKKELGHAGLSASLSLLSRAFEWKLEKTTETLVPVLAKRSLASAFGTVKKGRVAGIHQVARGFLGNKEVVCLDLTMELSVKNPGDTIEISGQPSLRMQSEFPGDFCTIATVLSAIPLLDSMAPGFRTVLDLPAAKRI